MSDRSERRAHPRHAAELNLHATEESAGVVARMITRDLSLGGVYCTSKADFPEMTRLAVRLMVPDNGEAHPLDVEAVVVRRQAVTSATGQSCYELALLFTGLDETARSTISRLIEDA